MRLNKMRKNGKLYVKMLLAITLGIVLVLIASSSIYYFTFARILQNKAFESDLSNLTQTGQSIAKTTGSAQTVAFQIYRNSSIAKILYYENPNPFDIQGAMMDLKNYLNSMPFLESIYVYNAAQERFYIVSQNGQNGVIQTDALTDTGMNEILTDYKNYKAFAPIPRIKQPAADGAAGTPVYTYLCYDAIGLDQTMNSAIIVNVSADWINQGTGSGSIGKESMYLIDDRGVIRSIETLAEYQADEQSMNLIRSADPITNSDFIIADFEQVKSLVTFTAHDQFDWYYVRITPYDEVVGEMKGIRAKTLQTAFFISLAGILLAWFLSKYLYVPINKMALRMEDLESEKRNSSYTIRQNMLQKLVQIQDFDPHIQLIKLKGVGISFDFTRPYRLAYLRIDHFGTFKERSQKDILTYKFAIMNIGTEIVSQHYRVESLDLEDDGILMLLNTGGESDSLPVSAAVVFKEVQQACMEYLQISVTAAVTPVTDDPHRLHEFVKQAKEASLLRFFAGRSSIIETSSLANDPKAYSFPVSKEKRMIEALMAGKTSDAKTLYAEIMQGTSGYPFSVAILAAKHLNVALHNMLEEIERNGSLQLGFGTEIVVPSFENFETLEEMTAAFDDFFDSLKSRIVEKRSGRQEELIRKINDMIVEHYMDSNLSLNYIADTLNMSTYHISRVYRQQTLTTIVDVINQVRMDHAQKMLLASDAPVSEIAEKTGYTSSSYFHRMFKKLYGVTPSEFRNAKSG